VQENANIVFAVFFPHVLRLEIEEIHSYEAEEIITGGKEYFKMFY
jgi:hypothetical protein